jgi:large subunit ribosomal protein L9
LLIPLLFPFQTLSYLSRALLDISMNKEQPWTIEPWHIRLSARKAGIIIKDDDAIELPAGKITGPDVSLEGKEFYVTITVNKTEKVNVRCRIHHWSTEPGDRIVAHNPWFQKAEPVFEEQKEVLEKIPLPQDVEKTRNVIEFK